MTNICGDRNFSVRDGNGYIFIFNEPLRSFATQQTKFIRNRQSATLEMKIWLKARQ